MPVSTLVKLVSLGAVLGSACAQTPFPSPAQSEIVGSGPSPPPISSKAAPGTWSAPASSVTVNGQAFRPPSLSGMGRQAQVVAADNFCVFMPPDPITQNLVDAEPDAVAYCFNPYNDTRPMPDGFIKTAHFRKTPDYVQITGTYDWTKMNLNPYDCGGEYDNHGALGVGNPVGAFVDGSQDWNQFLGHCDVPAVGQFCLRACHGGNSYPYCRNTFDLMGCLWVMPGDYQQPGFSNCEADSDLPPGVYNSSYTFYQGGPTTPTPVLPPTSSNCYYVASPTASGVTYEWAQFGYQTDVPENTSGVVRSASNAAGFTVPAGGALTVISNTPLASPTSGGGASSEGGGNSPTSKGGSGGARGNAGLVTELWAVTSVVLGVAIGGGLIGGRL